MIPSPGPKAARLVFGVALFLSWCLNTARACSPVFPSPDASIQLAPGCYTLVDAQSGTATITQSTGVYSSGISTASSPPVIDLQSAVYTLATSAAVSFANVSLSNAILFPPGSSPSGWLAALYIQAGGSLRLMGCTVSTSCAALATWASAMGSNATTLNSSAVFITSFASPTTSLQSSFLICDPTATAPTVATASVASSAQLATLLPALAALTLPSLVNLTAPGVALPPPSGWPPAAAVTASMVLQAVGPAQLFDMGAQPSLFGLTPPSGGSGAITGPSLSLRGLLLVNGCVQFSNSSSSGRGGMQATQALALMTPMAGVQFMNKWVCAWGCGGGGTGGRMGGPRGTC